MPGSRHHGRSAPPPPEKSGQIAWLGVTIVLVTAFHAVKGVAEIARGILRTTDQRGPRGHEDGPSAVPAKPTYEVAGWVLLAGAFITVKVLSRAVSELVEIVREILQPTPRVSRE